MIVQKEYMTRADGVKLIRTYSDEQKKLKQVETGVVYDVAIDIYPVRYTYVETNEYIDDDIWKMMEAER